MRVAGWVHGGLGLWLMAAPDVVGYDGTGAADVHHIVGPLVATFGIVALWAAVRDLRLANLPLAVVLVGAPLFGGHPAGAAIVGVGAGVALMVTAPFGGEDPDRRGSGWRGVVRGVRAGPDG